jgi:hypothetical protein
MIPKELSHSTPEISLSIDPEPRQTGLESRQICSFSSITAPSSALGSWGLANCQWLTAKCCPILPFIRPRINHERGQCPLRNCGNSRPPAVCLQNVEHGCPRQKATQNSSLALSCPHASQVSGHEFTHAVQVLFSLSFRATARDPDPELAEGEGGLSGSRGTPTLLPQPCRFRESSRDIFHPSSTSGSSSLAVMEAVEWLFSSVHHKLLPAAK